MARIRKKEESKEAIYDYSNSFIKNKKDIEMFYKKVSDMPEFQKLSLNERIKILLSYPIKTRSALIDDEYGEGNITTGTGDIRLLNKNALWTPFY